MQILALPAFQDNYIWCLQASNKTIVVIDPGDAQPVIDFLDQHQLQLTAILITHHHSDHCGGVMQLTANYQVPVYGPKHETIAGITYPVAEPEHIKLIPFALTLQVVDIPGHTRGHVAYYGHGKLFCGDTLFGAGCGRLFEGTPAQMFQSLQKIAALPDTTHLYCAHEYTQANLQFALAVEPNSSDILTRISKVNKLRENGQNTLPSTLAEEKLTNPFLRCHVPGVIAAASHYKGYKLTDAIEVFATLREWKNNFKA